jgi:hypothetical protein
MTDPTPVDALQAHPSADEAPAPSRAAGLRRRSDFASRSPEHAGAFNLDLRRHADAESRLRGPVQASPGSPAPGSAA